MPDKTVSEDELDKLRQQVEAARKKDAAADAKRREDEAAATRAVKAERLKAEISTLDGSPSPVATTPPAKPAPPARKSSDSDNA